MSDQFEKDIFTNVNSFRKNPQSIQHQIEVLHRGISRFKASDPFLLEIEDFIKTISSIPKMPPVVINKTLCDIAASEVKKYAKNEDTYNPYRIGKELDGIIPEEFMDGNPALIADNGADEAETIVPKLLLNQLDKQKKGRKILCSKDYTQFGVARIRHDDENYYIIIFAKDIKIKTDGDVTISVRQKDYVDNYRYYESKIVSNRKQKVKVQHKRHGQIGGSEKGSGDPDIYEKQTTMNKKETHDIEKVNKAFEMISPKNNGYISRTFNAVRYKKEKRIEGDGKIFEKNEIKTLKDPAERRKERKKEDKKEEKIEDKKEKKIEEKIEEKKMRRFMEKKEEKKEEKKPEIKTEEIIIEKKVIIQNVEEKKEEPEEEKEIGGGNSKLKSIRKKFYKSRKK